MGHRMPCSMVHHSKVHAESLSQSAMVSCQRRLPGHCRSLCPRAPPRPVCPTLPGRPLGRGHPSTHRNLGGEGLPYGRIPLRALNPDQDASLISSLPFIGLLSTTLALGLVKLTAYSQLEVVRTAMLSRHVKNGGAKVLQLGGTTRDLYYYPAKTLSVTVNLPDGGTRTRGLFEQAGITVGIPTTATTVALADCLASTPTASLDSVVAFEQFGEVESSKSLQSIAKEISRVLKPGGTFIFYERIARDGGLAQVGGKRGSLLDVGDEIAGLDVWDFCEYDTAAGGLDRHDVGVAIKGLRESEMGGSVDSSAFEALVRKNRSKASKDSATKKSKNTSQSEKGGRGF